MWVLLLQREVIISSAMKSDEIINKIYEQGLDA